MVKLFVCRFTLLLWGKINKEVRVHAQRAQLIIVSLSVSLNVFQKKRLNVAFVSEWKNFHFGKCFLTNSKTSFNSEVHEL